MNPDSFKGKLLLSIVDKFLIGLAVMLVVIFVQSNQRQDELVEQERIAVARVVTAVLADQQTRLMASVSDFMGLIDQLKLIGTARDATAEHLRGLEQDIRGSVAVLQTIHSARTEATCEPRDGIVLVGFTDSIKKLTVPLLGSNEQDPEDVQAWLDALLLAYAQVLNFIRCLAVDTVHHEVAHIHVKRPWFPWTRIWGESNIQGGGENGSPR